MNNGSSHGNNRNNNQQGKSYRGYYGGNKSNEANAHKKNFPNNRYNQRPSYDQSRNPYPNNNNGGSSYQGNRSGINYYEGSNYNSGNDNYYKKSYQKGNSYYNEQNKYQEHGYPSNKAYISKKPVSNYPPKQRNVIDALLDDTKTSLYFDIFLRYHKFFKKQMEKGMLTEQDFVHKFEELKRAYTSDKKLEENLKSKLGKNQEKLKLDKLQYDISLLHHENIENIKAMETKIVDEINLM